jgi:hypothetical protein
MGPLPPGRLVADPRVLDGQRLPIGQTLTMMERQCILCLVRAQVHPAGEP